MARIILSDLGLLEAAVCRVAGLHATFLGLRALQIPIPPMLKQKRSL